MNGHNFSDEEDEDKGNERKGEVDMERQALSPTPKVHSNGSSSSGRGELGRHQVTDMGEGDEQYLPMETERNLITDQDDSPHH